jgi:hypothetical protein
MLIARPPAAAVVSINGAAVSVTGPFATMRGRLMRVREMIEKMMRPLCQQGDAVGQSL